MNIHHTIRLATAAALFTIPVMASDRASVGFYLDQIVAQAKQTQTEAREISGMLKAKQPQFAAVSGKMEQLERHASDVNRLIASLEGSFAPTLTGVQSHELQRMKNVMAIINVFIENKKQLLASDRRASQRSLLRAKADGIAQRAALVQESALRIRG